jgi:WD40 repeat protein
MLKCLLVVIFWLAACAPATSNTPNPAAGPGTFVPLPRNAPTQPPPPWVEGAEVVTLQNVTRIANIGRLDARSAPSTVFAYATALDSARLAGLNNEQVILWDLISGKILFNTSREQALFVYYSPDKTELYTLANDGLVTVYNADNGQRQTSFAGHPRYNGVATYYPDEGWLALGGQDGQVKVWDVAARQSLVTIVAHALQIRTLAFSPDGKRLASGSDDGKVILWDWRNKQSQTVFADTRPTRLVFSPDTQLLAEGRERDIRLLSVSDGKVAHTLNTGSGGVTDVLVFSPKGDYLVNGGGIPALQVWDPQTGALVNTLPGVGGDATSAAFTPDGGLLATSVLGGGVTLWDMSKIRAKVLQRADLAVSARQVLYVDWTSDGHLLLVFDGAGPVHVWGVAAQPTPTPGQG